MIVSSFPGVPIKKGIAEEIGSVVPRGKGKEKKKVRKVLCRRMKMRRTMTR